MEYEAKQVTSSHATRRNASARERATFQFWYYSRLALQGSGPAAANALKALSTIISTSSDDCANLRSAAWNTICAVRRLNLEKELGA